MRIDGSGPGLRRQDSGVPAGRLRYRHPGEFHGLLGACPVWLRPIVGLAVATGMRRGEILGLRWVDVDQTGGRLLLPQTKNGEGRLVYLNELATQVLDSTGAVDAKPADKVFRKASGEQSSMEFRRAAGQAGIEDFKLHDLPSTRSRASFSDSGVPSRMHSLFDAPVRVPSSA